MEIRVTPQDPVRARCDALVLLLEESDGMPRTARAVDAALGGRIQAYRRTGDFRAKKCEVASFPAEGIAAARVILVGLGKEAEVDAEALRRAAGVALRTASRLGAGRPALLVPRPRRIEAQELGQALAEGAVLGTYRFDKYRHLEGEAAPTNVESLQLLTDGAAAAGLRRGARTGEVIAASANLARDLSNEPGSVCTPAWLAERAREVGREVGARVRILADRQLEREKMGGILAVGRGSANPPRLIVMEYEGRGGRRRPSVALVGKGITFDTGGISIKPAQALDEMKHDMSGGAAVIAAVRAAALLELPVRLLGVVPAAQNSPDGNAYLPGDVIVSASGKTIEVLNTDAEGRIVLADALHYATRWKPDAIVDLATLTGACVVALGPHCCGLLGNDEALLRKVQAAGERTFERAWPLPLWDEHREQLKGKIADIVNVAGREAGTSTAAAFLSHFVGETPWAHLDIAGTAWVGKEEAYRMRGATGFGVRLVLDLLRHWR